VAAAAEADALVVGDARRDVHLKRLSHRPATAPAALPARLVGNAAVPAAGLAALLAHELPEGGPGHCADAARAAAGRAGLDRRAGLGAVPVTVLAGVDELVRDLDASARGRLGERDLDLHGDVAALDTPATTAAEPAAEGISAEERVEDVCERTEAVGLRGVATRVEALEPVAVVCRAPFGVREDLVGLRGLLELLLRLRVVAVHVGVELARQAPERLLDLGVVRLAGHAEHLVRVAPHSSYTSATKRDSSLAAWRTAMIAPG
jgi:hypothetical protein